MKTFIATVFASLLIASCSGQHPLLNANLEDLATALEKRHDSGTDMREAMNICGVHWEKGADFNLPEADEALCDGAAKTLAADIAALGYGRISAAEAKYPPLWAIWNVLPKGGYDPDALKGVIR